MYSTVCTVENLHDSFNLRGKTKTHKNDGMPPGAWCSGQHRSLVCGGTRVRIPARSVGFFD